jgi:hypothetical protein
MFYSQETNEPTIADQGQREPTPFPVMRRRRAGCFRTGAATALALLLVAVFGVGMVAGWAVGRNNAGAPASNTGPPGKSIAATTGTTLDMVRESILCHADYRHAYRRFDPAGSSDYTAHRHKNFIAVQTPGVLRQREGHHDDHGRFLTQCSGGDTCIDGDGTPVVRKRVATTRHQSGFCSSFFFSSHPCQYK